MLKLSAHRKETKARAKRLWSQRGDTVLTAVLAAGFVAMAAAGSGAILKMMKRESIFANVNAASQSVESAILLGLQSPETYTDAIAEQMRKGGINIAQGTPIKSDGETVAVIGGSVALDAGGHPCTPSADHACAMTSHVQINCSNGGCKAAYQVYIDPTYNRTVVNTNKPEQNKQNHGAALPPLGSPVWPPREMTNDYSVVLGYDLFRREAQKTACAPGELFISGMDKANGNVSCVLPSQLILQPNEVGETMEYHTDTHSLELKPRALAKLTCPDKYVLSSMEPRSLDTDQTGRGICSYRYKKEVPWLQPWPSGKEMVQGAFCPQEDYGVVPSGSCTVSVTSQQNGTCPDGSVVRPNISYRIEQRYDRRGPNAGCRLIKTAAQPCGASWSGEVHWSGTCKLLVSETQDAVEAR